MQQLFDHACRLCPRLSDYLQNSKKKFPDYHCAPVAPFGDLNARLLVVGLAPGLHGANASGRPFTGDHAGILLYQTLFDFGFATAAESNSADDTLQLKNCRITNAVKCVPPENKPTGMEVNTCNQFLSRELQDKNLRVILALGGIAHKAVLKAKGIKQSSYKFGHNATHPISESLTLLDSYHCSRYNTQTKRLTPEMFRDVFAHAKKILDS